MCLRMSSGNEVGNAKDLEEEVEEEVEVEVGEEEEEERKSAIPLKGILIFFYSIRRRGGK